MVSVGAVPFWDRDESEQLMGPVEPGTARQVRVAPYMAALTASQRNPVIREFYERLQERGKPKKVPSPSPMPSGPVSVPWARKAMMSEPERQFAQSNRRP